MRLVGGIVATLCLILAQAASAAAQDQITLRIGHITNITAITGQGSTKLAETAKTLSNGAIKVEIFPSGQLGGELEMVSQVRLGTLDMAVIGSGIVAALEPTFSITELPFIWKDGDKAWQVLNGPIGQRIMGLLEPKGVKGLAWGVWGFRGFITSGTPISRPEDLKGQKVRVIENPVYVRTIRALGGNPVPMAWPEVYTGLQQGTIDGVDTNYLGMADSKLYEVARNLSVTDHIFTATVFIMNLKKFQSLSPEYQEILLKAAHAGGEAMREGAAKANADAIALIAANGGNVLRPPREPFEAAIKPVHDYFAALVGPDLLAEVKAAQQ